MWCRASIGGFALVCLLGGCGDDGTSEGDQSTGIEPPSSTGEELPPNNTPVFVVQTDVATACTREGATRVELHALQVGCVNPPPAPCTVPSSPTVGDAVDCPGTASESLRVEIAQAGRYTVEVVTQGGDEELFAACWGENGQSELLVTEDVVAAKPTVELELIDNAPCG